MDQFIQKVKQALLKGQLLEDICQDSIQNPDDLCEQEIMDLLKKEQFTENELISFLHFLLRYSIPDQLQRLAQVYPCFLSDLQPNRLRHFTSYINRLIEQQQISIDLIPLIDRICSEKEQALRIINMLTLQEKEELNLESHGEIAWQLFIEKQNQLPIYDQDVVMQWIYDAHDEDVDRGHQCAMNYIRELQSKLEEGNRLLRQETNVFDNYTIVGQQSEGFLSIDVSDDMEFVVTGGYDKQVKLWDLNNLGQFRIIGQHDSYVQSVKLSRCKQFVVSGSQDKTVRLWRLNNQQNTILGMHDDQVSSVMISSSSAFVVSGSSDGQVKLWNLNNQEESKTLCRFSDEVLTVAISESESFIVIGTWDYRVVYLDIFSEVQRELGRHKGAVNSIAISRNEQFVVSGSRDGDVRIWNLNEDKINGIIGSHGSWVTSVVILSDDSTVVSAGRDMLVKMWHLQQDSISRFIGQGDQFIEAVCMPSCGRYAISAEGNTERRDYKIVIWIT